MYLMMDVIREVDRPVSADGFREAFESGWRTRTGEHPQEQLGRLESIKSRCRDEQRFAFDAFEGTHKWESLEKIGTAGLPNCATLEMLAPAWIDTSTSIWNSGDRAAL